MLKKSKSTTSILSLFSKSTSNEKYNVRIKITFDNPDSRACPFTLNVNRFLTLRQLKLEIIKSERLRGRGDLFELLNGDEDLLLDCLRLYKTSIDVGAESQFRQFNKSISLKTPLLAYFKSQFLDDDDEQLVKYVKSDSNWIKSDQIIHFIVRIVPYGKGKCLFNLDFYLSDFHCITFRFIFYVDTLTLLAQFEDDISVKDNSPPVIIDADSEWSLRKLKSNLIKADGRPINPKKCLLYATDCPFEPKAEVGYNYSLDQRTAKVPLRVESLKVSNFFPPKSDFDKISIILSFNVNDLPPKIRYCHSRPRFIYDPSITKRDTGKHTKWKPSALNAKSSNKDSNPIDKSQPFLSLPHLDFNGNNEDKLSSPEGTPTTPSHTHSQQSNEDHNQNQNSQYSFLAGDTDTSVSLALALASFDKPLAV